MTVGILTMQDLIGCTLGHYRIVEKIGEGGMGEVYRARDERLDRDVAVKVLPTSVAQDPERIARFEREAKAVAKLEHSNILAIYDFGTDDGVTYSVTELLEGETLRERLEGAPSGWRKAAEIGASIADGLAAAHGAGIIHRDLKPDNVFLTADGRVKILDFGLARDVAAATPDETHSPTVSRYTDPGAVMGTAGYMSPEQVRGEPADARSDIFALGSVLYEMATGSRAFARDTAAETMTAILREQPGDFDVAGGDVAPELRRIITRCLEKNPEERFQSARDLAFDLRSIANQAGGAGKGRQRATGRTLLRWVAVGGIAIVVGAVVIWRLAPHRELAAPTQEIPRIVVLPFENLGPSEDEYFADGLTSEIINRLAVVSGLEVISRTSAMRYKNSDSTIPQIGEELEVDYALEGEVRWEREPEGHGRVRITSQLIRVATDSNVWSERYDQVLEDIFTVQSEIAGQVIAELQVSLFEPEQRAIEARPTDNMEAYQAYLLGAQYRWASLSNRHLLLTVEMMERAVRLDPDFALAHAMLSEAHSRLYHMRYDFTSERLEMARASAERAMDLQPGIPEGHRALGAYYYYGFRDYDRALEQCAIAAETLSNDADLWNTIFAVYRRQGRWDEALEALEQWQRVDPQRYLAAVEAAITYSAMRDFDRTEQEMNRAISIAPDRAEAYWESGAWNYLRWDGSTQRARELLASAPSLASPEIEYISLMLDLYDRKPDVVLARLEDLSVDVFDLQLWYAPRHLLECMCLSDMGERQRALAACSSAIEFMEGEIQARPHDYRVYSALGHAFALLGRSEEAVRAGQRAVELMGPSKDALDGPFQEIELAKIYTRVGQSHKALDLIEKLLSIPCDFSVGLLRLDPVWDPLRDHPRFQALLEKYEVE
jgi:pentatricopeptide repeat protein